MSDTDPLSKDNSLLQPTVGKNSDSASELSKNNYNHLGSLPQDRHCLTHTQTQAILSACASAAVSFSLPSNIAVTDPSGLLLAFIRTDNAFPASIDIAIKKARTVSLFNGAFSTAGLNGMAQPGAPLYTIEQTNGGMIVFGGGVPVFIDGKFLGAIGVSGGTVEADLKVAEKGLEAIGAKGESGATFS